MGVGCRLRLAPRCRLTLPWVVHQLFRQAGRLASIASATRSNVAVVGLLPLRRNRYRPITSDRNEKRKRATQPSP